MLGALAEPSPPAPTAARSPASVVTSAAPAAARAAVAQAARLRRPVAITARLFGLAFAAVAAGAAAAGVGLLLGFGTGTVAGPAAVVVAAALYAVPLWLLWTCRKALLTFPRFLDSLAWTPPRSPRRGAAPDQRPPRAPLRVLRATGRLARGATGSVRAAAEMSGLWRLASPLVSIGGAVSFIATPVLTLLGLTILLAGLVLA